MKEGQRPWTREELIVVFNLYCKLPFGRLHRLNPDVIHLAELLNRTSGAVAYKLVNFASLDPALKQRGIKGATNTSKLDREIWHEFYNHWDVIPFESEKLLAQFEHTTVEKLNHIPETDLPPEGKVREQMVKVRVNQQFFRRTVLSSYNNTCCITGINQPDLLIAGHIRPWGVDEKNRLNPCNGILLNALHDKAFENGHITITEDYRIKVSPELLKNTSAAGYFNAYEGKSITLPSRFLPDAEFLKYHNTERFKS